MQLDESLIRSVVAQVLAEVGPIPPKPGVDPNCGCPLPSASGTAGQASGGQYGIFYDAASAVAAARKAFEQLRSRTLEDRRRIIDIIRRIAIDNCEELGLMEMEETKIGRPVHKIEKLKTLGERSPGVEFLESKCFSGDYGLAVIERSPFGVIAAITPSTHSLPTITGNAVSMIAGGNAVVVNPHPSGKKVAAEGVRRYNQAIAEEVGIDNLICVIAEPTLESADQLFAHRDVALICVTGGPAVGRAALNSGKRAIVAGPGNPPVVVDETADLDNAARCIIQGAAYDNNLLCIAEKEVFVVESVFDDMMTAMKRAGAVQLNREQIQTLTSKAIAQVGDDHHDVAAKDFIGKDAKVLAQAAGVSVPDDCELIFGETDENHPFVSVEQMMPFVPFVRATDVDHAIAMAKEAEHGFRHTAIIHSRNVHNMTKMGRELDTTLYIKNGPCMAGLGLGGEGYLSFSIAGPTGEGVTTPTTFTRERRCSMIGELRVV
ncbi:aldehyde dehydrogenase family protein [Novipirellula artificiosorum]|uniref:Succinate-semialdehyde dehydrogenase (Acetylating) n=1 Tax=Novipirellula artificiosorum TaxID=2528016 RepID=A0A5C6E0L3_9BACT|nr:aldehyde dehydrogenase family protein [Novipirellula artificiosorum]TWU40886.1 Succinate-semialdehyde dehydrogenase (acetylating) [Novipirellula artificiosorum]